LIVKVQGTETVQVRRTLLSYPYSECASCRQQGHAGSKTSLQQNTPVLNWGCRLTQVVLYNGHKTIVVVDCQSGLFGLMF